MKTAGSSTPRAILSSSPSHLLRHDPDALNTRALRRVDHTHDLAVAQRAGTHDEERLVAPVLIDLAQTRLECVHGTDCWLIASLRSAEVLDDDMLDDRGAAAGALSDGRFVSSPRCDSGSAAMKMTSSTSSTSIIGVMFRLLVGRITSPPA